MEIPEHVAEDFRRILSLQVGDIIPAKLTELYNRHRRMKDICSDGAVSTTELILLTIIADCEPQKQEAEPKEEEGPTFHGVPIVNIPDVPPTDLKAGDKITTVKDGKDVTGIYIEECEVGTNEAIRIRVKIDGHKKFSEVLLSDTRKAG